jgi:isocitrate dehydrogenase
MFEAVHGSAPDIAGRNLANPTALILSAVLLLRHIGEFEAAARVKQAVLLTLEQGIRTGDIAGLQGGGVGTVEFTDAVIGNLGAKTANWTVRDWKPIQLREFSPEPVTVTPGTRRVIGVDVFVESPLHAVPLGQSLESIAAETPFRLKMISNRGTRVYPPTGGNTDCVDHWRCRFVYRADPPAQDNPSVLDLITRVGAQHRWMHIEKLQEFDGKPVYARAQGED